MFSSSFKICSGLMFGGCAIGVPTYICTKSNGTFSEGLPSTKTSPRSSLTEDEKQFYNCLDKNNQVQVTEKGGEKKTFYVSWDGVDPYLNNPEYETKALYNKQCQEHNK